MRVRSPWVGVRHSITGGAPLTGKFVSTTGNNANAGTELAPWRDILFGATNLGVGETLYIRGGTYAEYVNVTNRNLAALTTIRNYPGEPVQVITGGAGGVIRFGNCSNWRVFGLEVHSANPSGSQGGGITFDTCQANPAGQLIVERCVIHDITTSDNPAGVLWTRCYGDCIVRDTTISDIFHNGLGNVTIDEQLSDSNGVLWFGRTDDPANAYSKMLVEHCDLARCGVALKYKHPHNSSQAFMEWRYNYCHDNRGRALMEPLLDGALIHHNLVVGHFVAVPGDQFTDPAVRVGADFNCDGAYVYHNTCYDISRGIWLQTGSRLRRHKDNLFRTRTSGNGSGVSYQETTNVPVAAEANYNLYWVPASNNTTGAVSYFGASNPRTLTQIRADRSYDLNSLVADPLFVNVAGGAAGFKLQAGSPALDAASEGVGHAIGCYELGTEVVGVRPE